MPKTFHDPHKNLPNPPPTYSMYSPLWALFISFKNSLLDCFENLSNIDKKIFDLIELIRECYSKNLFAARKVWFFFDCSRAPSTSDNANFRLPKLKFQMLSRNLLDWQWKQWNYETTMKLTNNNETPCYRYWLFQLFEKRLVRTCSGLYQLLTFELWEL